MINTDELYSLLPEAARAVLAGSSASPEQAAGTILRQGLEEGGTILRQGIQTMVLVFAALLLCAVCRSLLGTGHVLGISVVGSLAVTAVCFSELSGLLTMVRETLTSMDVLSKALFPALAAVGCAAGAPAASAARYVAVSLFSSILFSLIRGLLLPMTVASAALCAADAALPEQNLGRIAKCLSSLVKWILTAVLTAFVTYLTFTGVLSGSEDAALIKGAKLGISTVIPVVGSVLADAADTVLSAAKVVRGTVGAAGLLGLLALCVLPFLRLGVGVLLFRLTAALCAPFAEPGHCRLLDGLSGAYGLLLGQVGAGTVLIFLSVASSAFLTGGGT